MKQLYTLLFLAVLFFVVPVAGHAQSNIVDTTVCGSFTWHDSVYMESGDYFYFSDDSAVVDTLSLTVYHDTTTTLYDTVCNAYQWNDSDYHSTGVYTQHFNTVHGCDSIVTLHLTVFYGTHNVLDTAVCESFIWHEIIRTQSGTYTYEYNNADGCASADTLHLTIYQPTTGDTTAVACGSFSWHRYNNLTESGIYHDTITNVLGCDSIVTLHLTVNPTYAVTDTKTICASELPYTWNSVTFTAAGTQTATLSTVKGCDSVVTMTLMVNPTNNISISASICMGESYTLNGFNVTPAAAGISTHTQNLETVDDCDSVVTLTLTTFPTKTTSLAATICLGESYTLNGFNVSPAVAGVTTYEQHLNTVHDCDSVVTLTLTTYPTKTTNLNVEICQGETYDFHGQQLASTGVYVDTISSLVNGCDSVITLTLIVKPKYYSEMTVTSCDSYTWNDTTYMSSGNYIQTFQGSNGCDSIVTLHLTITQSSTGVDNITACDSYTWIDGLTYTTSNYNATYTLTNAAGCDSVVTLHLTIHNSTTGDTTAVACERFTWHGVEYTSTPTIAPTYTYETVNGCDSIVTLHLTFNPIQHTSIFANICQGETYNFYGQTIMTSGMYMHTLSTVSGCDSIILLTLTVNPLPMPLISGDMTICPEEETILIAGGGAQYDWSTGETTSQITVKDTGNYSVTVTDSYGCQSSSTVSVVFESTTLEKKNIVSKNHDGKPYMLLYPDPDLQYQWYWNGILLKNENKQYYAPVGGLSLDGTCYTVSVAPIGTDDCGYITSCWSFTGKDAEKVSIIPNPNNGHFKLQLPSESSKVQIFNANGQLVFMRDTQEESELEISTDLTNGFYIVKVLRANGEMNTEKLIINR